MILDNELRGQMDNWTQTLTYTFTSATSRK